MHHSKSSNLLQPGVTTEHTELTNSQRARRRSSLDTFLIPGRTRIPSSKASKNSETDVTDSLITRGLLRHSNMRFPNQQPPSAPTIQYQGRGTFSPAAAKSAPRSGGKSSNRVQKRSSGVKAELVARPPPQYGSRGGLQIPSQRPRTAVTQTVGIHLPRITSQGYPTSQELPELTSFDGPSDALGSGRAASRMTSMTWSTVSHRLFTDSSGSSRRSGASYYLVEYNELAEKYGLRRIPETSSEDSEKTTTKNHHGWLARNIFRRTSSTYTLKAKTTYKPLTRKKSLGGIPLLSNNAAPKNIITGKSLEELSRLGGIGVLLLPNEFAVDKLTLPTSLSAIAAYLLQHGCNAPGLFRISGQTSTINALYDFYDHQFSDGGSPSKVEATVGSGLLPTHIEYTLADVASLFKKILIGLPGGLLGSLELFEAFEDILLKLQRDPEQMEVDFTTLKAKLVALAISTVTSICRVYLIEAVLGLCAHFAFETDKAHAALDATAIDDHERPNSSKSELMGYQSLGVVLGPLLLGDLADKIEITPAEGVDVALRKSSETAKGSKKPKRISIPNKLEKNATLTAQLDRAKMTVNVVQQLLLVWRDVVKQLREISGMYSSSIIQSRSTSQLKKVPIHMTSSLRTSEEEVKFMDFLRGRKLPEEYQEGVQMKRKVRISSRSPIPRGAIEVSKDGRIHVSGPTEAGQQQHNTKSDNIVTREPTGHDLGQSIDLEAPSSTRRDEADAEDRFGLTANERTHSDLAMDQMALGTILPRHPGLPDTPGSKARPRHVPSNDLWEDEDHEDLESFGEAPQTIVKLARTPNYDEEPRPTRQRRSLYKDKPLPPIGSAQRAEQYSPSTKLELTQAEARELGLSRRSSRQSTSAISTRQSSPRTVVPSRHGRHGSKGIHSQSRRNSGSRDMYFPDTFPPRHDSSPVEGDLQMLPIETYATMDEYHNKSHAHTSPTKFGLRRGSQIHMSPTKNIARKLSDDRKSTIKNGSRKGSAALIDSEQLFGDPKSRKGSAALIDSKQLFGDPKRNSVKLIAQQFGEKSRAQRKEAEITTKKELPKVYAYVHSLSSPNDQGFEDSFVHASTKTKDEDPFVSSLDDFTPMQTELEGSTNPERESVIPKPLFDVASSSQMQPKSPSPEKESMIPKPRLDIGRGRRAESCSPSPPKCDSPSPLKRAVLKPPGKRASVYNVVSDQDAEIVRRNTNELSDSAAKAQQDAIMEHMQPIEPNGLGSPKKDNIQHPEVSNLRPSASTSSESLPFHSPNEEHVNPTVQPMPRRITSIARSESPAATTRSDSPSHSLQKLSYPEVPLTRSNSFLQASDHPKMPERHGSLHTTMYTENLRLRRQLEQMGEEAQAAKRGVEMQKIVDEKRSLEKEREADAWRIRAEEAERKLAERNARKSNSQSQDQGTSPSLMVTANLSKDHGASRGAIRPGSSLAHYEKMTPGVVRSVREPIALSDQRVDVAKLGQRIPRKALTTPSKEQGLNGWGGPEKSHPQALRPSLGDQGSHAGASFIKTRGAEVEIKVWERCGETGSEEVEVEHKIMDAI